MYTNFKSVQLFACSCVCVCARVGVFCRQRTSRFISKKCPVGILLFVSMFHIVYWAKTFSSVHAVILPVGGHNFAASWPSFQLSRAKKLFTRFALRDVR